MAAFNVAIANSRSLLFAFSKRRHIARMASSSSAILHTSDAEAGAGVGTANKLMAGVLQNAFWAPG